MRFQTKSGSRLFKVFFFLLFLSAAITLSAFLRGGGEQVSKASVAPVSEGELSSFSKAELTQQVLVYPVTDYGLAGDSYDKYASGYGILTKQAMVWFRDHYLRRPEDASDWRASPICAAHLAGVAPAIVITAECDVLHDDGERYAEAPRRASVPVEYKEFPGMIHAFFGMVPAVDDAMNAQRMVWAAVKRAFALA